MTDRIAAVRTLEALVGAGNWGRAAALLSPEAEGGFTYRCAALAARSGVDGLRAHMEEQGRLVRWEGHDVHLEIDRGDLVIIEVTSRFLRLADGAALRVPCTDIWRFRGDRVADWRVYADISPFRGG